MTESEWLAEGFEKNRTRLKAVAYRMLDSLTEADDALQEAWLHLSRSDTRAVENLKGWLTTVVARLCLDMLRSRSSRREVPLGESPGVHLPDPIVSRGDRINPEQEALLADAVGLVLLVLENLTPAERVAFVLHDTFSVPFEEIAPIVGRSPAAARQLASRARRRVQGAAPSPEADLARQREVVDAFLAAARNGHFEALLATLDPDVMLRSDGGALRPVASVVIHGARSVAEQALIFSGLSPFVRPAVVNGAAGVVVGPRGRPFSVMGFTVRGGKIVKIDVLANPERLSELDLAVLDD